MATTFSFEEAQAEAPKTFGFDEASGKESNSNGFSFEEAKTGLQMQPEQPVPRNGLERAASNYQQERAAGLIPGSDAGTVMHQEPNTLMGKLQSSLLDDVLPHAEVKPEDSRTMAIGKEVYNLATGIPKFATSPGGIAAAVGSEVAAPVVTGAFLVDMLKSLRQQAVSTYKNWDNMTPGQKAGAATQMVGTGLFAKLLDTHLKQQAIRSVAPLTAEALKQTKDESLKPRDNIQPEEPNAIPERSSETLPVEEPSPTGEKVGEGTPISGEAASPQEATQEEIVNQPVNKEAQPELIGTGGAVPSEFERGNGNPTSNKNEVVDKERQQRGLPEMMTTLRQTWGEAWTKAMAKIDDDPAYQDKLVAELNDKPRPITDTENAALLHRRVDLRNEYDKSIKATAQALDDGRLDAMAESKLHTAYWSDKLTELENATKGGGSETGRALAARKMLMNEDFSLASLELQKRAANDFRPLTDNERTELKQLADDYKAKNDALEKHLAEQQERASQSESARAIAEAKVDAAKGPQIDPFIVKIAEKIGQGLKSNADAARERIKARLGKVTFGSGPLHEIPNIKDYAIIGAEHIYSIGLDFAKWSAKMVGEFGDDIKPHLKDLFELSKNEAQAVGEKQSGSKDQAKRVQKAKQTFDEQKQDLSDTIAEKVKSNNKDEIGGSVEKLARLFVANGITDREKLIDAVHGVLKESMPEITRREAMDAISKYGEFSQLSKDDVSKTLRDLKGQMQQMGKLEDMKSGKAPQKTGVERREPSDEERRLIQQVNEAKRKGGFKVTDPATQLKSALGSIKTRLKNEISDLENQISTKIKTLKQKTPAPNDAEVYALRQKRDTLKKEFERIFPKEEKQLTDAQRIKMAMSSVERQMEEYNRRIKEKDFGKSESKPVTSPELESAKAKRDALREQYNELRDLDEHYQQEQYEKDLAAQKKALEDSIADKKNKLASGDVAPKPSAVNRPAVPELESLKQQRDDLNKQLAEARNKPAEQKYTEQLAAQVKALQKRIADKEAAIAKGDVAAAKPQQNRPASSPELEVEKQRLDAVNKRISEMRKGPKKSPEERALQAFKTRTANRITDLQERLDKGDFSKTPKRETKLDQKAVELQAEAARIRRKFEAGLELDRRSKLTRGQRILEAIPKWSRAVLLSGPSTLAKLTFAAIETMAIKPIEETAGYAIGKVIPKVAEKARVEGGLNLKAESRAITQGIVKGMRESWNILRKGSSDLDEAMGKDKGLPREVLEFFGQVHGALKTVPKQAAFERTLQKLNDHDAARGVDITDPMIQTKNIAQAYKEANKAIFMEDNRVVNMWKAAIATLKAPGKGGKQAGILARSGASALDALVPIVKVPTNLVARTFEYALGLPWGGAKILSREVRSALGKQVEELTPEQADLIMSNLKKGSLGAAVLLLGYFNADKVGGYYQRGEKKKPGDPKHGSILVNGHQIPSLLLHNPLLETLQIGATIRHVAESKIKASEDEKRGLGSGTMAGLLGLVEETPFVRETTEVSKLLDPNQRDQFLNELVKSRVVPQIISQTAEFLDKDSEGNKIKRKPENIKQAIESGIPGLRERVPAKR